MFRLLLFKMCQTVIGFRATMQNAYNPFSHRLESLERKEHEEYGAHTDTHVGSLTLGLHTPPAPAEHRGAHSGGEQTPLLELEYEALLTHCSLLSLHLPRVQTRIAFRAEGLLLPLLPPQALNCISIPPNQSLALHPFLVPASQRTRITEHVREEHHLVWGARGDSGRSAD